MDIRFFRKSISQMDDDESFKHIRYLRSLRREMKKIKEKKVKIKTKGKKKTIILSAATDLDKLSAEEKNILLQKMLKLKRIKGEKKDAKKSSVKNISNSSS